MIALEIGLSIVLGSVFLISSVPKLRHPKGFVFTVLNYHILPPFLSTIYAMLVPPLEFLIGLGFFLGTALRVAGVLMALLLMSYIVAISINLARGRSLECNCFGSIHRQPIGLRLLLQDSALLLAAILVAIISPNWFSSESWSIFRLIGLASTESPIPLFFCIGLTLIGVLLSPSYRRKRKKLTPI
jgi:hypothetical protein